MAVISPGSRRLPVARAGARRSDRVRLRLEQLEARRLLTSYYVSLSGDDGNSGTSPASPWRSIAQVNRFAAFQPDDAILFQGGANFQGNLVFRSLPSTRDAPITLGSYGIGRATIDAGDGTGIDVEDTQGFLIQNLNVAGSGFGSNNGNGIAFLHHLEGTVLGRIEIDQVDVSGFGSQPDPTNQNLSSFNDGWGIYFAGFTRTSVYADVRITNSAAHDNGNGGVLLLNPLGFGARAENVLIDHVQAFDNPGVVASKEGTAFGILLFDVLRGQVNRCEAFNNGWLPTTKGDGGGIGALDCADLVIQHCESYANKAYTTQNDGDGFFLDACADSYLQYDYSHDNYGPGYLLCSCDGTQGSYRTTIRFSVSENDSRRTTYGGIYLGGHNLLAEIYNNTVFMSPAERGHTAAVVSTRGYGLVRNNIFATTPGVPTVVALNADTHLVFQGNDYWSGGGNVHIAWPDGTTYLSLAQWQSDTHQEQVNGRDVGFQQDPMLVAAGGGGTVGNADQLEARLTAYQLQPGSPLVNAGLNLAALFQMDPGTQDFFGVPIPPLSVGAGGAASAGPAVAGRGLVLPVGDPAAARLSEPAPSPRTGSPGTGLAPTPGAAADLPGTGAGAEPPAAPLPPSSPAAADAGPELASPFTSDPLAAGSGG